jgi:hypothetical protein
MKLTNALSMKGGLGVRPTGLFGGVIGVATTVWANRGLMAGAWKGDGLQPGAVLEIGTTVIMISS